MVKVKNVQSGIVIIADAGIKLTPGGTADLTRLTSQAERAIEDGLLVRVDEPETRQKAKATSKTEEQTGEQKPDSASVKADGGVKNGAG